jgi:uncharacterized integral membrane protein
MSIGSEYLAYLRRNKKWLLLPVGLILLLALLLLLAQSTSVAPFIYSLL